GVCEDRKGLSQVLVLTKFQKEKEMRKTKIAVLFSVMMIITMLISACGPATTPTETKTEADTQVTKETTAPEEEETEAPTAIEEPAKQVTISFWHAYNADVEAKFLDEVLIPQFEADHPSIKVQSLLVPYDQFRRKLLIALSGGSAPDVARVDIIWTPELADQGALAKLDEVMSDFSELEDAVLPGPLSTNYYKGHYYGLPLDTNTRVLAYNKDMFAAAGIENPPATIDEFLADCEKIKALGEGKYCFADGGTYAWAVNPWIWSMGGDVTDPEVTKATGYFNGEKTANAYKLLKDMLDNGYLHPGITGGGLDTWGSFAQDQVAMILEGPWFPSLFGSQFPDKQYGLALMPAGDGGSISVVGGEDIVMFEQSENKEAAAEFIRYMLSEKVQLQWAEKGQMPVIKSAADSDVIKNHPYFGIFLQQLETAKARSPHPAWSQMEEVMTNAGAAILTGTTDVQAALDEAATKMDELMASYQ
ncbi:MAG: extracellular solute-binding protein, partial [Bacteroidales bacterium]|nr:extracellular solute-binding protein [Bacteroidales bacterium]